MQFNFSEDTVKAVSLAFNNVRDFILKPAAGWAFTIVMAVALYINGDIKYDRGLKEGKQSAKDEVASLKKSSKNDEEEIYTLKGRVAYYKKQLDTCNNSSVNANLEDLINKKLDEAERIKRLIEKKLTSSEKINASLKTALK